ncbi:MAG: rod shape-determining protein, partial [Clostridia bacterium]|nr:rod shape-determining protein [Clostridia bacterium]
GDIVNENLAALLLEYFLEKIEIPRKKAKRVEAVFILPCGAKTELKQKYLRIAEECGLAAVYFTVTPFAAVLGHNVAISESTPMFVLDIGHSITNIAAISQDGIIYGLTVNLGGANIDVHLIDELAENYNFKIGALTAEKLKISVGSLLPDDNKMNVVEGGKPLRVRPRLLPSIPNRFTALSQLILIKFWNTLLSFSQSFQRRLLRALCTAAYTFRAEQ